MFVYLFVIILILFLRSNLRRISNPVLRSRAEGRYLNWVSILLVLLASFRGLSVGADTYSYAMDYYKVHTMSYEYLKSHYSSYWGYYYLSKFFASIGLPLQFWFGFIETIYIYALTKFIKRYSLDKLLSVFLFFTIGLFTFSLAGLKQVMAMSFMMLAFLNFVDKKYIRFLLTLYLSYIFHPAALIFIFAFPLYWLTSKTYYWLVILAALTCVLFYGHVFLSSMVTILDDEHFESYLNYDNSYSYTTLIFYIILLLFSLFSIRKYTKEDSQTSKLTLGLSAIAIGLQSLSSISPNMFRLAYLYTPFMIILLPNTLKYEGKLSRNMLSTFFILFVTFYFLYTSRSTPYKFFWQ